MRLEIKQATAVIRRAWSELKRGFPELSSVLSAVSASVVTAGRTIDQQIAHNHLNKIAITRQIRTVRVGYVASRKFKMKY